MLPLDALTLDILLISLCFLVHDIIRPPFFIDNIHITGLNFSSHAHQENEIEFF